MTATRLRSAGWLLHRLAIAVLTVLLAVLVVFVALRLLPGDPARLMLGDVSGEITTEQLEQMHARLGLDRPIPLQFLSYLVDLLHGDWGVSSHSGEAVSHLVLSRLPVTLELSLLGLVFALVVGTGAGVVAAARRGRVSDLGLNMLGLAGISVPNFWLGIVLLIVFTAQLRWFPASGYVPFTQDPVANLTGMVLPTLTLGSGIAAVFMRQMRSETIAALEADHVRTARSKGLSPRRIVLDHAARNSLITIITLTGLQMGALISGAVVVEQVFVVPGIGRLLFDSVLLRRDLAVVQGIVLVTATVCVLASLTVDVAYRLADPRIRVSGGIR